MKAKTPRRKIIKNTAVERADSTRSHRTDKHCGPIVVIDRCAASRNYLVDCLEEATDSATVVAFASASHWLRVAHGCPRPKVVPIFNSGYRHAEGKIENDRSLLADRADTPVIAVPNADAAALAHAAVDGPN
jgi:hypothetical protein